MAKFNERLKKVGIYLSQGKYDKMKSIAEKRNLPLSRIICYALDNAMSDDKNFEIDIDFSKAGECLVGEDQVVLDFVNDCSNGIGMDYMLLYHDNLGLSKAQVKNAIKKLTIEKRIDYTHMKSTFFNYQDDYLAFIKKGKGKL